MTSIPNNTYHFHIFRISENHKRVNIEEYTGQGKPWKLDGEPNSKGYRWYPGEQVPTYDFWSEEQKLEQDRRVERSERIRRLELVTFLAGVFSQDFAGKVTSHPMLSGGRRRGYWRQMREANLLPEPGRKTLKINTKIEQNSPETPKN